MSNHSIVCIVCIVCGTRSRGSGSPRDRLWLRGPVLRGHFGLARTPPWALTRHDRAAYQQLAAPDTPGLPALERTGQASQPGLASPAHRLGRLHVLGRLSEEQFRVLRARKIHAHRERGDRTSHRDDADLIEYLPDVWLLPRHHGSGRLEPRRARLADGGIAPLHRCHPLSLLPVLLSSAISRPSWDLGLHITRPRTRCSGPRPREELLAGLAL